jgi:sulfur carrier protein
MMAEAIQIQVNGEQRGCRADATVGDLLRELAIKTERVAVELNLEILDRMEFDHRSLKQGDRVEILSFIGGGAPLDAQGRGRGFVHAE